MRPANFEDRACDYWATCLRTRLVSTDGVSAFSSMEMVNRTRDMLLTELKAIQHLVTLTVARFNNLSITARLPAEVLTHVFSILAECDPPSSEVLKGDRSGDKVHLGWIAATHVCRRWRHVALSAPALWTNIGAPQTGPWMNTMLARSKQVPFTLSACITRDLKVCDAVLKAVSADYMSRMKNLHLSGEWSKWSLWSEDIEEPEPGSLDERRLEVLANLKHPAPVLESLTLDTVTKILPPHMFARTVPRLRRLIIRGCESVHWGAPYLRNLTGLELDINENLSLAKLLEVLKESLLLEDLRITGRYTTFEERRHPRRNVSLLSLKTFFLHSWVDTAYVEFLASLTTPPTAGREFEFKAKDAEVAPRVIAIAATGILGTTGTTCCSMPSKMQLNHDRMVAGRFDLTMRVWFGEDFDVVQPRLALRWTSFADYPAADHIAAEQLLGSFDLHKLTDLSMSSEKFDFTLYDTFKNAFRKMSAVRDFTLKGRGVDRFLRLLKTTPRGVAAGLDYIQLSKDSALLLPNLDCLRITGVPLGKTTPSFKYTCWAPNLGESLLIMLKTRKALGKPVSILVITGCDDSEALSPKLAEHVENLRCDGYSNA